MVNLIEIFYIHLAINKEIIFGIIFIFVGNFSRGQKYIRKHLFVFLAMLKRTNFLLCNPRYTANYIAYLTAYKQKLVLRLSLISFSFFF